MCFKKQRNLEKYSKKLKKKVKTENARKKKDIYEKMG